jgi:hypothetical protein
MPTLKEISPERALKVNRSELRADQSSILDKAVGEHIVVVKSPKSSGGEKYIIDSAYFNAVVERLQSAVETLEIMMDSRLFDNIRKSMDSIDEDMRLGRLHNFDDAFK